MRLARLLPGFAVAPVLAMLLALPLHASRIAAAVVEPEARGESAAALAADTVPGAAGQEGGDMVVPGDLDGDRGELNGLDRSRLDRMERLLAIYRRIPGLRDVRITLEGGILEIGGTALTSEDRDLALAYARDVIPDVDFVDARGLLVETDLRKRLEPAAERIRDKGLAFLRFLPSLLLGFVILGLGAALAAWLGNRTPLLDRAARNPFARNLLRQAVRGAVFLTALLLALDLMGVTTLVGAVLGAAGVAGIAVGFAFRDIVENYLAGILLSLRQPFAPNDHVILAGEEGRVARLTGRETVLMTLDGNHVRIPNATVFKAVITNLTRNPRRRFGFSVGIAPWENLGVAIPIARDAVAGLAGVLETPGVSIRVQELQDSSVLLRIHGWVDQTEADFGKVRSRALRAVKEAFEREGVETPPPEFGVRLLDGHPDGAPPLPGAERPHPERPGHPSREPSPPRPDPAAGTASPPGTAKDLATDSTIEEEIAPDTTIEDEIARELHGSREENLLQPLNEAPRSSDPSRPPPDGPSASGSPSPSPSP